jgi:hypothetical protein
MKKSSHCSENFFPYRDIFFLIMMKFTTTHYNLIIVLATTETRLLLKPYKTKTIQMFFGMYIHFSIPNTRRLFFLL